MPRLRTPVRPELPDAGPAGKRPSRGPRGLHPAAGTSLSYPSPRSSHGDDLPRLASQKLTRFAHIARYVGHDIRKDLSDIIGISVPNNLRDDLTGVLAYDDGHFIQLLEGPGYAVTKLMMRIMSDPRATEFSVLFYELVDERAIGEFTMLPLRLDVARNIGTLGLQFRQAYRQVAKTHDIAGFLKLLRGIIEKSERSASQTG
jgi:hypothetical protein